MQEQHYDPFGLDLTSLNAQMGVTASRFTYNGKEEQGELGWLDYGARMYDPAVPRWLQVDPHLEKYESISPFSYGFDNPIRFVDLQGKDPGDVVVLFSGAHIIPFTNLYGSTNRLLRRLNDSYFREHGGSADKFKSDYSHYMPTSTGVPYFDGNPNNLTQEAYDYIKNNLTENGRLVIYGYSWGGILANYLTKRLKEDGIMVDKLIVIDGADGFFSKYKDRQIPENVEDVTYVYQESRTGIQSRGYPASKMSSKTKGRNVKVSYVKNSEGKLVPATHTNIDDAALNHVLQEILKVLNASKSKSN